MSSAVDSIVLHLSRVCQTVSGMIRICQIKHEQLLYITAVKVCFFYFYTFLDLLFVLCDTDKRAGKITDIV